jgi:RND family efflux transporter MFP subunit
MFFVLSLALTIGQGCKRSEAKKDALPPPTGGSLPPPVVPQLEIGTQAEARRAASKNGFHGTGTLHPRDEAELGPKATGVLTKITVDEGDSVKKGQLLFTLDAQQAGLGIEQAKAALETAKINMQNAELDFRRTKELFERGSVPPATFDQAKSRYDMAKSAVAQGDVAVSQAQKAAADTAVRSPITGVVTSRLKNVGETVTMMPPTVVLIVQDVSVLELRARLPERVLAKIKQDDELRVSIPAIAEERKVRIRRINPTIDARTRTVEIVADLDNTDGRLKPGMLAEVRFGSEDAGKAGTP